MILNNTYDMQTFQMWLEGRNTVIDEDYIINVFKSILNEFKEKFMEIMRAHAIEDRYLIGWEQQIENTLDKCLNNISYYALEIEPVALPKVHDYFNSMIYKLQQVIGAFDKVYDDPRTKLWYKLIDDTEKRVYRVLNHLKTMEQPPAKADPTNPTNYILGYTPARYNINTK